MIVQSVHYLTNSGGGGEKGGVLVDAAGARGLEPVLDVVAESSAPSAQQPGAAGEEARYLASEHPVRILILAANKTWRVSSMIKELYISSLGLVSE